MINPFDPFSLLGGIAKGVAKGAWGTAKMAGRAGFAKNPGSRFINTMGLAGIGSAAGAAAGYLSSDSDNPTQKINSALWGGLAGAGAIFGGAGLLAGGKAAFRNLSAGSSFRFAGKAIGSTYTLGKDVATTGLKAASFAGAHPIGIGMAGAGMYGAGSVLGLWGNRSPTARGKTLDQRYTSREELQQEEQLDMEMPDATDVQRTWMNYSRTGRMLQNSTFGLTLGLHSGRHG